ncbi:DUF4140 domain-containing protein [Bordetella bronchiseptica]|uniref:DUF4140 domain-containing protein n=1 Tax=Bordetella bronchiseptica TaxID=518 RepID=UPI0002DA2E83|nr:DUF4140 domain-containing protein [Bordetella bronchiseptica]KAK74626.1 hypothetical protein L530_3457 [Bordetella bronchiseptica MO211]
MTNQTQNNAAQAQTVLTDEEYERLWRQDLPHQTHRREPKASRYARAVESTLLSKLRAPVADERAPHIKALQDLRLGVEMDQHCMDDGDAKLAALDAAITALRWSAGALQALNVEADKITLDGETRTVGDILDHADRALASAPVAGEALDTLTITLEWDDGKLDEIEVHGTEKMLRRLQVWLDRKRGLFHDVAPLASTEDPKLPRGWKLALNLCIDAIKNAPPTGEEWPVNWPSILHGLVEIRDALDKSNSAPQASPVAGETRPTDRQEALRITELPDVDEALATFCSDGTQDNAVGLVLAILGSSPQASPVSEEAVYTLRVRGAIQAWTPTVAAFSIPDGEHQLFLSPAAPQASAEDVRIRGLEAARFAYASEFAPDENGDPDVGSIHANIRKLKAELANARNAALEEVAAAVENHQRARRQWIPESLWGRLSGEAAARIRALKSTPAPTAADGGDDVALPPLPHPTAHRRHAMFAGSQMTSYAKEAVLADRQQRAGDDMLTIAYLAGAQAEKERAGDALLAELLDDPLLRDLLGYIEDTGPADLWGAAQAWMAKRNAALAARKEGDAHPSATQIEQGERDE